MANETILRNGLISKASSEVEGTLSAEALAVINSSGTTQFTLPTGDGSANQILVTNGSGTVTWADNTDVSSFLTGITSESIFSLSDVDETSGSIGNNEVLKWDGSNFVGVAASSLGSTTLAGLTDVTITAAADGDFLRHNGSAWVDSAIQNSDIASGMITQHQGDISITVSQVSDFTPGDYLTTSTASSTYIPLSQKGAANGVATLDSSGLVPSAQLPSYVDDVLEYANESSFPASGEAGKLYVDLSDNSVHRWSGSAYIDITDYSTPGHTHVASDITDFDTEVDNQIAAASIDDLSDVSLGGDTTEDKVLAFNASGNLVPTAIGDLSQSDSVSSLTDTTISGTPADNEVLAYNFGTSQWINQTASEAGLATSAQGALADSAVQPADLSTYIETTDSVTDLSDVTNIGSNGNIIVNSGGNLVGVSSISHDSITNFDSEVNALITATDISDLSNTSITELDEVSAVGSSGQILVSNGTNLIATTLTDWKEDSTTLATDAASDIITAESLVGSYGAITLHYSLSDGTNMRMGTLMAITDGSTVELTDISTNQIGSDADEPVFSATTSGSNLAIKVTDANGYTVKSTYRLING